MPLHITIPVLSAPEAATHVQVQYAISQDGLNPPEALSHLWRSAAIVPVGDIPTTVRTAQVRRGTFVWVRAYAVKDGQRVSNFPAPQVTEVPLLPGFTAAAIVLGSPQVVTWTPNAATGGIRIRWGVGKQGGAVSYSDEAELDAGEGMFEIPDVVPIGSQLTVQLIAFELFESSAVAGDQGEELVLLEHRPGPLMPGDLVDPAADLACRVIFDNAGNLVVDNDHCLVLVNPKS